MNSAYAIEMPAALELAELWSAAKVHAPSPCLLPALLNAKLVNSAGRGIKGERRVTIVCNNLCKDL